MQINNSFSKINFSGHAILRKKDIKGINECLIKKADDEKMQNIKTKSNISRNCMQVKENVPSSPFYEKLSVKHCKYAFAVMKELALNPSDIGKLQTIDFAGDYTQIMGDKGMLVLTTDEYSGNIGNVINTLVK